MKSRRARAPSSTGKRQAARTVQQQRKVQRAQDARDRKRTPSKPVAAVQAGPERQPVAMPRQHLKKPGREAQMALKPRFLAQHYRGSGKLQGQVALITGADTGIGRAVAVLFAREGADIAIIYLNEHDDARETQAVVEREGARCMLIPGDVRRKAFCRRAVATTVRSFGKLDILVNNAAFQEHAQGLEELDENRFDLTLATNVLGYFHMAKAAIPHLKEGAAIINTGSVTGLEGSPHLLDYASSKGAIHAFTKSLASNLLSRGIRVNAVAPGPVWTPLNPADKPSREITRFGRATGMKRVAQPEEISPAYVFLAAQSCSSYITGIVLPITGSVGSY